MSSKQLKAYSICTPMYKTTAVISDTVGSTVPY